MHIKKELEAPKWKRIRIPTTRSKNFWWSICQGWEHNCKTKGTVHNPGTNVYIGKDHTLHAKVDGLVKFTKKKNNKSYVSIQA